jgi:nitrite reductase (NO-forming)
MKNLKITLITTVIAFILLSSCSNKKNESPSIVTEKTALPSEEDTETTSLEAKKASGKVAYEKVCQACHQADGKGIAATFPPIANSDYLDADINRAIDGVVNGLSGEITVNGEKYNSVMPPAALTDEEIADVFTYILNNFGNKGGQVETSQVKALRK